MTVDRTTEGEFKQIAECLPKPMGTHEMKTFLPGQRLRFAYVNHRGVTEQRDVIFKGLDYGDNEWYPERQWFMRCYDVAREADRSFALARIDGDVVERLVQ